MAASLGLGHETYSYPAASVYVPPDLVAENGAAALGFPPPAAMGDYFPELGAHALSYSSPPPVCAAGNEMNLSYVGDERRISRSAGSGGGRPSSRIGFRTRSEVDVLDDGFKWRKYGKKAVKSSPNPRNYYRCSAEGCGVKKRVERDSDDPRYVVTTYDGVHNHAAPGCHPAPPLATAYTAPPPMAAPSAGFAAPCDGWRMQLHSLHAAVAANSSESSY
ncbi:hypothetical protein ACP70R_031024 [Stipagrostis hirtigluma subsp. patula]